MPWCEECAKYFAPSALNPDGTCPSCGRIPDSPDTPEPAKRKITAKNIDLRKLAAGAGPDADNDDPDDEDLDKAGAPWHFKLLIVLTVLYMIWRIYNLFR